MINTLFVPFRVILFSKYRDLCTSKNTKYNSASSKQLREQKDWACWHASLSDQKRLSDKILRLMIR